MLGNPLKAHGRTQRGAATHVLGRHLLMWHHTLLSRPRRRHWHRLLLWPRLPAAEGSSSRRPSHWLLRQSAHTTSRMLKGTTNLPVSRGWLCSWMVRDVTMWISGQAPFLNSVAERKGNDLPHWRKRGHGLPLLASWTKALTTLWFTLHASSFDLFRATNRRRYNKKYTDDLCIAFLEVLACNRVS